MMELLKYLAETGTNDLIQGIIGKNYLLLGFLGAVATAIVKATRTKFDDRVWAALSGRKKKDAE